MRQCAQCGSEFSGPKTKKFCQEQCRWDASNGRPSEQSLRRRETGFAWDPVRPARKVEVKAPKSQVRAASSSTWRTAVILPDTQIGYRRLDDGTLDPFHDEVALDVATQIVASERPDDVVMLGDFLDFPMFGRYRQEPAFAQTAQPALERGHELLATLRELARRIRVLEGNHDARLHNYILDNALAAAGLRRAKAAPASWPVLSVPYLLRLEELGVEYVGGYPSGATYLNDNLACVHGSVVGPPGQTAGKVVQQELVSTIHGHIHRHETAYKTRNSRGRAKTVVAHSPGCLCRVDGAVPSQKSSTSLRTGKPSRHFEDWQQGLTVVRYQPDGDQKFVLEPVFIQRGWAMHRGQEFTSTLVPEGVAVSA